MTAGLTGHGRRVRGVRTSKRAVGTLPSARGRTLRGLPDIDTSKLAVGTLPCVRGRTPRGLPDTSKYIQARRQDPPVRARACARGGYLQLHSPLAVSPTILFPVLSLARHYLGGGLDGLFPSPIPQP